MRKCSNCGHELDISDRFCSQCGTKQDIELQPTDHINSNADYNSEVEHCLSMLNSMEGLDDVKREIKNIVEFIKKDRVRTEMMGYPSRFPRKYIFIGNPRTGRTTVARLLANILNELGVMPEHKMIAVWSKALVGNITGQSIDKVRNAVASAVGGVLFIDDIHLLDDSDVMVQETVDELIQQLSTHHDDLVCIIAGTPAEMKQLFEKHPGLQLRFDRELIFER
jgi:AAA+ superfamily predicted ATPase